MKKKTKRKRAPGGGRKPIHSPESKLIQIRLPPDIVARIAARPDAATVTADVAAISAYGYATLAARLLERLAEERTVSVELTAEGYAVRAPFSETFREALGRLCWGRRWDREGKVWRVPSTARKGLWDALREAFPGAPLVVGGKVTRIA